MKLTHLAFLLFCFPIITFAQIVSEESEPKNPLPAILPPEISKMAEYGDYTSNLNKGIPNISIPIHTIKTKNGLEIPISLDYVSKGIKVDELASNVGLGWVLSSIGVITIENENESKYNIGNELKQPILDLANQKIFSHSIGMTMHNEVFTLIDQLLTTNTPTVPEIYHINCFGIKGSFIIDSQNKIHNIPASELEVSMSNDGQTISVRDGKNNIYIFKKYGDVLQAERGINNPSTSHPNSFFALKKIELNNNEIIEFEHSMNNLGYSELKNIEFKYNQTKYSSAKDAIINPPYTYCVPSDFPRNTKGTIRGRSTNFTMQSIKYGNQQVKFTYSDQEGYYIDNTKYRRDISNAKAIRKIEVLDNNTVISTYDLNYNYFKSDGGDSDKHYRLKLNEIVKNGNENHSFEYNENVKLPPRLSYSQDAWGYFNGKNNSTLLPKLNVGQGNNSINLEGADRGLGSVAQASAFLLNKITYPTKGYTEFKYERDTKFNSSSQTIEVSKTLSVFSLRDASANSSFESGQAEKEIDIDPSKLVPETFVLNLSKSCENNVPGPTQFGRESSGFVTVFFNGNGSGTIGYAVNKNLSTRDIGGPLQKAKLLLEWIKCSPLATLTWKEREVIESSENVDVGTLRLASYKSYDENGSLEKDVRYSYSKPGTSESSFSGGTPTLVGNFSKTKQVIESNGEAGGANKLELKESFICSCVVRSDSSIDNYDESKNGYRFIQEITKGLGAKEYEFINRGTGGSPSVNVTFPKFQFPKDRYRSLQLWNNGLLLDEKHYDSQNKLAYQLTNKYEYDFQLNSKSVDFIANDRISYGILIGEKYYDYIGKKNSVEVLSYSIFNITSAWIKKTETATKQFRNAQEISTNTKYFYENVNHLQLTKKETTTSNNTVITEKYYYPADLNLNLLNNRKSELVKFELYKNGNLLRQSQKVFKDWGNGLIDVEKIEVSKGNNPMTTKEVITLRDTSNGNILESINNGKSTVYLYGYNKSLLIAKIDNSTKEAVASALGVTVANLNTINETKLTQINNLRQNANFKEAMINTYEHKPLVGVIRSTDANGVSISYEYNTANQLQNIKDASGNILEEYEYNYKTD